MPNSPLTFAKQKYYRQHLTQQPDFQVNNNGNQLTPIFATARREYLPFTIYLVIDNPPDPLILYVNPSNFKVSSSKVTTSSFTRNGWVTEHWGDDPDVLTVDGVTGGTYTAEYGLRAGPDCVDRFIDSRLESAVYQELRALLLLYKNNGRNFKPTDRHRIERVGTVVIVYDGTSYYGHFDSFQFKDVADKPHNFEYSFTFRAFDTRGL